MVPNAHSMEQMNVCEVCSFCDHGDRGFILFFFSFFFQYDTVSSRWLSTFWSNILPHYSY